MTTSRTRALLSEFLTTRGYVVLTASHGEEALRTVKEERPHLILLDICMPKMNGLEVLKQVREIDHEVGVIMATAVNEEETGREAPKLGALNYITKPLDFNYLERSLWYKIATMMFWHSFGHHQLRRCRMAETILVVDDYDANRELLDSILTKDGYLVKQAENGVTALTQATSAPPDLILLDLSMPGIRGCEVCQSLRRDPTTVAIPVIVVTAYGQIQDKEAALVARTTS